MKKTEQKVLNFIREKNLIQTGDKILVALSGGPDSVFLLRFLVKYSDKLNIKVGAIHVNHMIRGKAALEDEEFCVNLSLYLGIVLHRISKKVKSFACKNKISLEEAGRKVRYSEFEKVGRKYGYNKIATAHNCNDNAETVLLNLIKGAGLKGISGIPFMRGNIIRPILNITKEEILNYLDGEKLNYRVDLTNLSSDYERNFLRNEIIPLIQQRLNPDVVKSLFNSSEIFKDAALVINNEVEKTLTNSSSFGKDELKISLKRLRETDKKITGFFLKSLIEENFAIQVTFNDIKKIISLIENEVGRKAELTNKLYAVREREEIIVTRKKTISAGEPIFLKAGDVVKINGNTLSVTESKNFPVKYSTSRMKEFISADNIKGNFLLRRWKVGEKFLPIGLDGSKKISDFLNEQKLPSSKKKEQLVLTNNNKIVWVVGLRLDERFKITNHTKKVYELWLK